MSEDFESEVRRQVERLQTRSLSEIEAEVTAKRLAWYESRGRSTEGERRSSPRDGFELLSREYLCLPAELLTVVSDTAQEITWLSRNPCPTLEACRELGLDTRVVCRGVYERSTQALLSRLDPRLRFRRDYEEIRPYAEHCREMIVRVGSEALTDVTPEAEQASAARD